MASAKRTDWQSIVHVAARRVEDGGLSDEDGAALGRRIIVGHNDVDARVRLVGFYFLRSPAGEHRAAARGARLS